jgi:hypothetical protein
VAQKFTCVNPEKLGSPRNLALKRFSGAILSIGVWANSEGHLICVDLPDGVQKHLTLLKKSPKCLFRSDAPSVNY